VIKLKNIEKNIEKLHYLTDQIIENNIDYFLGNKSDGQYEQYSWLNSEVKPDFFTIGELFENPPFLYEKECEKIVKDVYIKKAVSKALKKLEKGGEVLFDDVQSIIPFLTSQVLYFFDYVTIDGQKIQEIYYTEFPDTLMKVLTYCLTGQAVNIFHYARNFNQYGHKISIALIEEYILPQTPDFKTLLHYAVAAGIMGLDMKPSQSPATEDGIPIKNAEKDLESVFNMLISTAKNVAFSDYKCFEKKIIQAKKHTKIVWLTDDYIESIFDLLVIQKIMDYNYNVHVTLVPKDSQYSNDLSYADVYAMIHNESVFNKLKEFYKEGRLELCLDGNSMGSVNFKKMSKYALEMMNGVDYFFVKGCRSYEMIQGSTNVPMFCSFCVIRGFTISQTGFNGIDEQIVLKYLKPGEFIYKGFKERRPDNNLVRCTLKESIQK
jgi:hypothetical protein